MIRMSSYVTCGSGAICSADADLILHSLGGELYLATFHLDHFQIHVLQHLIQSETCADKVLTWVGKQTCYIVDLCRPSRRRCRWLRPTTRPPSRTAALSAGRYLRESEIYGICVTVYIVVGHRLGPETGSGSVISAMSFSLERTPNLGCTRTSLAVTITRPGSNSS